MINTALLAAFIPTFILVSLTPGMCMTLSMSLGITIGVRRTFWMMAGELVGVGLVAVMAVIGVAAIMLGSPMVFTAFKWAGGAYLMWLGIQMWQSKGKLAIPETGDSAHAGASRMQLAVQGFVTAVANPKGWAFFMVLLPPFLDDSRPLAPQLAVLVTVLLMIEWLSLILYASGGKTLSRILARGSNVRLINRVAGTLMMAVGVWLALG
ncbi:LysE family translocator [Saccharospirillum salsuginis]|uniref:Threonine transporter RhtB n=1 Tax=Saccharospirillum salsuginis TaxID=418750 RepID=A0A918K3Y0_9GAMM|nr:LysE family translocator [Saccharospirillum salsuginis]GGX48009.1 threonine transporter RhtB [Saccharospirillum salsuginis]